MAMRQGDEGGGQGLSVEAGTHSGEHWQAEESTGISDLDVGGDGARSSIMSRSQNTEGGGGSLQEVIMAIKVIKPLPHAVIDYAWAGAMIAAPWLFGFSRNKKATANAVTSGAAILGLNTTVVR